jgi:hypothetical protein
MLLRCAAAIPSRLLTRWSGTSIFKFAIHVRSLSHCAAQRKQKPSELPFPIRPRRRFHGLGTTRPPLHGGRPGVLRRIRCRGGVLASPCCPYIRCPGVRQASTNCPPSAVVLYEK